MKIVNLRCYLACIPLKATLITAYGKRETAEFVIVEVETDEGITGVGEAPSIPIYDEGNPAGDLYVIEQYLRPMLIQKDPTCIAHIHYMMDKHVRGHRYAKAAIDIALYDILGKCSGRPVYELLGGREKPIPVIWLVSAAQGPRAIEEARQRIRDGFRALKVKVGNNWQQEVCFLRELRKEIGESVEIRLDANGAWHWKQALRYVRQMEELNISLLEQPVPAWDIEGLRKVTTCSPIPIAADECALTLFDVYELAKAKAADYVNIKLCRSGGFYHALKMIAVIEAAGMIPLVGSMLEYGVATMAGAHFAALFATDTLPAEVIGPLVAQDDIVVPPVRYENGNLILTRAPGLGIELDKEKLYKYLKGG